MGRVAAALLLLALTAAPARQVFNWVNIDHLNQKLCGQVIDFTHNHGADRRICSPILGGRAISTCTCRRTTTRRSPIR